MQRGLFASQAMAALHLITWETERDRVREEREKGEFGVEDGRKGDRKREYYGGKLKSMLIP